MIDIPEDLKCPKCSSENVLEVLGCSLIPGPPYKCNDCGERFGEIDLEFKGLREAVQSPEWQTRIKEQDKNKITNTFAALTVLLVVAYGLNMSSKRVDEFRCWEGAP